MNSSEYSKTSLQETVGYNSHLDENGLVGFPLFAMLTSHRPWLQDTCFLGPLSVSCNEVVLYHQRCLTSD